MRNVEPVKTLNMSQVMQLAGVSRRTVYNWIAAGKVTVLRTAGGSPRFYEHEIVVVTKQRAVDAQKSA